MKRKNSDKRKKGIFYKLLFSYVLFSVLVILSFSLLLFLSAFMLSSGNTDSLSPYLTVDEEGNPDGLDTVFHLGGWVEELDGDYNIIKIYGEKQTENTGYTQGEIYKLTRLEQGSEQKYIGFIQELTEKEHYLMCIYERDIMEITVTVVLNRLKIGPGMTIGRVFGIVFLVVYLLNCILLSLYLSRKIKQPLKNMVEGMERVRTGEEDVYLDFKAEAEFEQIRDSFNEMVQKLKEQEQEKIRLEKQKNQMLLELSHDINTPIATIKSYANALEAGLVPKEKEASYYHTIDLKADRVSNLAENMFTLLKMDNPDYMLQLGRCDMCELLRKTCGEYYDEIEEKGFAFEIEIPEEPCYVLLDEKLFSRVISNLLSNAIKYNETGRKIMLLMEEKETELQIDVMDDGELLDQETGNMLFQAFVRGDKTRKSDGGTGLGLSIAKVIVEKHGGNIQYRNRSGCNCFQIRLEKQTDKKGFLAE
ncbi:MAG: HAMP domain-containing histidine kinase [Lachnospiraceae bacterium]|nr:HAMP domain-containing histidine kinase [Lachnospiraceae bacterium]